jgi:signal peptidase I
MTLQAGEFIRRFLLHVLPDGFMRVRHFGFLANRSKKLALAQCRRRRLISRAPERCVRLQEMEDQAAHIYSDNKRTPRRPWLAGVASLAPPLGHVYVGRPLRGVVLALVMTFLSIGALLITLRPLGLITVVLMALILIVGYAVPIVDAVIVARRWGKEYLPRWYNRRYVYLLVFGTVATLGDIVKPALRSHLVQAYKLPSGSMTPTLLIGDHILTDKTAYKSRSPGRFDVVVFEFPEDPQKTFVDRVIGLPGETIEIRDKKVFINGTELAVPYGYFSEDSGDKPVSKRDSFGPFRIPDHGCFILGDNRDRSYDSRFWGPVGRDKVYGLVRLIYFSWDSENTAVRWDRIGKIVE